MKVWLDDVRKPPVGWEWAKTAEQAIALVQSGDVTEISLDHDLEPEHYRVLIESADPNDPNSQAYVTLGGPVEVDEVATTSDRTGYAVCLWMAEHNVWPPIVRIHSASAPGRERMKSVVQRYGGDAVTLIMMPPGSHPTY